jgi:S1-C subfamily serine protease
MAGAVCLLLLGLALGWLLFGRGAGPSVAPGVPVPAGEPARTGLAPEVLERARQAAVFLQVRSVSYLDEKASQESSGSGFFVSSDGRIATSWHVISHQDTLGEVVVPFRLDKVEAVSGSGTPAQKLWPARVLAVDAPNDLALLKVEAQAPAWLPLGNAGDLLQTMPLWVVGFPLGKVFSVLQRGPEFSINLGYVSSLRHDDRGRLERIQFDAAVTPGNSGGPVIRPDAQVVGVANIAIGTSRVNFAVPVTALKELLADCPNDRNVGENCQVEVSSEPAGAEACLDGKAVGKTPLKLTVRGGYRRLQLTAPGRRTWARNLSLYDGRKVQAELKPLEPKALKVAARAEAVPAGVTPRTARGKVLLSEKFSEPKAAEGWRQDTGGGETRTWYVEDGALHQFSEDGLLHAVFAGEQRWTDYAFGARVKMHTNEKDGRAGLIFRATGDGFALFRLHRARSLVQLAYHSNDPFGWQVLAERKLPFEVQGDHGYALEVQAVGDRVLCVLDGQVVLEAALELAREGGVGFYSVDSSATFDDAEVAELKPEAGARTPEATLRSFWFSDSFAKESEFWQVAGETEAEPWPLVPGARLQLQAGPAKRRNVLSRYIFADGQVLCWVSCRQGSVGLVLRDDGKRRYLFAVDPQEGRAQLLLEDGDRRKVLQEKKEARLKEALNAPLLELDPEAPRLPGKSAPSSGQRPFLLIVNLRGPRIVAAVNGIPLLDVTDPTLREGRIGLYTDGARALFHSLNVACQPEEP